MPRRGIDETAPRVVHVVGARPNYMKIAPLMRALAEDGDTFEQLLVHTGQHYDPELSDVFIEELKLPPPDVKLGVGSDTHAKQTAEVMRRFDDVLESMKPDWVVVPGDVNSTLAAALVAVKRGVAVAHVEAGLRSRDLSMPRGQPDRRRPSRPAPADTVARRGREPACRGSSSAADPFCRESDDRLPGAAASAGQNALAGPEGAAGRR